MDMKKSVWRLCLLTIAFLGTVAGFAVEAQAQRRVPFDVPSGPRNSVRGHIYIRNGIFRDVYRERWGNGIQPYGAAVLMNMFDNAAVVGMSFLNPGAGGIPTTPASGGGKTKTDSESESGGRSGPTEQDAMLTKMEGTANGFLEKLGLEKIKTGAAADAGKKSAPAKKPGVKEDAEDEAK